MDYKKMYTTLFNAITDAVNILTAAQQKTEEIFLSGNEPEIIILGDSDDE